MKAKLKVINAVRSNALTSGSTAYLARRLEESGEVLAHVDSFDSAAANAALPDAHVIVTGWGTPRIDSDVLDRAPNLRWILHVGGTVKDLLAREVWERGIQVSSAVDANAQPVAEYTFAMILMANKQIVPIVRRYRSERAFLDQAQLGTIGNYHRRVGIVGASRIGRRVLELLHTVDLDVVLHDPTLSDDEIYALGAEPAGLQELCSSCDVVTVHAPALPATDGMISREMIDALAPGATFINTARGSIVDQKALEDRVLRGDLFAILDVTTPWILDAEHPFYEHPNVILTPHIAGSVGSEVNRMIDAQLDELQRVTSGGVLAHPVTWSSLGTAA